jgi:hypothetical protein
MKPITKEVESERDVLYVLRRKDGSVFAELMMTPSMAVRINERRRSRGVLNGNWVPQQLSQYGLWHLDSDTLVSDVVTLSKDEVKRFNNAIPKGMGLKWRKADGVQREAAASN